MKVTERRDDGLRVIGTTPIRPDGLDKVTGRAIFADDIHLPGMLHGKVLRSSHAHARIKSIDTSRAVALPGVHAVISAADFPELAPSRAGESTDISDLANSCIATTRVLYDGHAVAAVAAENPHIAEQALNLIDVDYEVLEAVMDLQSAMADGAPVIHDDLKDGFFFATTKKTGPNVGRIEYANGDINKGFSGASVIVERTFTTQTVHQGYIEPHVSTALWNSDDQITIWTSCQGHFDIRDQLAGILDVAANHIKVIPLEIGGAFGGKDSVYLEPLAAVLSKKCKRPVKMAMNRNEVLRATGPASGSFMQVRMGTDNNGMLVAADISFAFEAGAFPGGPVSAAVLTATTRYNIPNYRLEGFDVILNKPKIRPYRAPGAPQSHFAVETVMDELAEKLAIDPIELRIRNAMKTGDRLVQGFRCPVIGSIELLEVVRSHPHYRASLNGQNQGRGVAYGFWYGGGGTSSAELCVNADGTVKVCTGSCDMSGTRMTLAMQTAEVLGIPVSDVHVNTGDTQSIGYTLPAWGSRTTFATGIACITVAEKVIAKMIERVANIWKVDCEEVSFGAGTFINKSDQLQVLTFRELAAKLDSAGGPVSDHVSVAPQGVGFQLAAYLVDVEVDTQTGKVRLLRSTVFQDVGKAVHPDYVSGQMQGGVVQGLGWALNEACIYADDGTLANTSFLDYRMPTAMDQPMTETVILETPNPGHPYGVRGAGEVSIVNPPAAVANAIYNAVGIRMNSLPMSPTAVLEMLWKRDADSCRETTLMASMGQVKSDRFPDD
jgi:xanthine dehydrogenase molybdenum-binding subunit